MSDYPTNLTEKQWQVIKNIVEPQERNRKSSLREIVNGIFYVNKSGCQWRMPPQTLLLGKRFITISENGSLKEFGKNC